MRGRGVGPKLPAGPGQPRAHPERHLAPSQPCGPAGPSCAHPRRPGVPAEPGATGAAAPLPGRRNPAPPGAAQRPLTRPSGLPRPPRPRVPSGRPLPRSCPSSCGPSPSCRTRRGKADCEVPWGFRPPGRGGGKGALSAKSPDSGNPRAHRRCHIAILL